MPSVASLCVIATHASFGRSSLLITDHPFRRTVDHRFRVLAYPRLAMQEAPLGSPGGLLTYFVLRSSAKARIEFYLYCLSSADSALDVSLSYTNKTALLAAILLASSHPSSFVANAKATPMTPHFCREGRCLYRSGECWKSVKCLAPQDRSASVDALQLSVAATPDQRRFGEGLVRLIPNYRPPSISTCPM